MLLASVWCSILGLGGAVDGAAAVCQRMLEQVRRLEAIEFTCEITHVDKADSAKAPEITTSRMKYAHKGARFRSEVTIAGPAGKRPFERVAIFDGTHHYLQDPTTKRLRRSSAPQLMNPHLEVNPLILPYAFAMTEDKAMTFSRLRDAATWESLRVTHEGVSRVGKVTVHQLRVQSAGGQRLWRVFSAEELGGLPLRVEFEVLDPESVGKARGRLEVLEYHVVPDQAGVIVIPLLISVTQEVPGQGSTESSFRIGPETLRINQPIPDDLFAVAVGRASAVEDVDANRVLPVYGDRTLKDDPALPPPPVSWWRSPRVLGGSALLVVMLLLYTLWRRRAS